MSGVRVSKTSAGPARVRVRVRVRIRGTYQLVLSLHNATECCQVYVRAGLEPNL